MKDRSTLIDLTLAFAAVFVITLALWPRSEPRQVIRLREENGEWATYSLPANDPNLEPLQEKVRRLTEIESDPAYTAAKWQLDLVSHYEKSRQHESGGESDQPSAELSEEPIDEATVALMHLDDANSTTAKISDSVATVSFEQPEESLSKSGSSNDAIEQTQSEQEDIDAAISSPSPSDLNYWAEVRSAAEARISELESRRADVPVVFESKLAPRSPQLAFHFAFLLGIAAACGYMHWLKRMPTTTTKQLAEQPLGVLARIGTFTGVIVLALFSAIAVWI